MFSTIVAKVIKMAASAVPSFYALAASQGGSAYSSKTLLQGLSAYTQVDLESHDSCLPYLGNECTSLGTFSAVRCAALK